MNFENKSPEWQNEGTEPTDEIKKIGFQAGYKPPAAYFNWFWSKVSKCINELQQKFMDAPTPLVGICNSVKGNSSKIVECSDFRLYDGARILVTFANGNSANYMTLNVNNTGAVMAWFPVGQNRIYNDPIITKIIAGGGAYEFVYQGGSSPKWMYCGATDIPVDDAIATFTEATERENINSGETTSTIFGKIKKWFTDLKTVAFTGSYNDLSNKPTSMVNPNSLTLTMNGSATTYNGSSTSSKTWYAPTSAGTNGYELISSGGAPVWKAPSYAVCSTSGETQTKTVSITNFKLVTGARIVVKFNNKHSSVIPASLNVSSTGAKPIIYAGNSVSGGNGATSPKKPPNTWEDNELVELLYDGVNWVSINKKKELDTSKVIVGTVNTTGSVIPPSMESVDFMCGIDGRSDVEVIQEAIESAKPGGVVILKWGKYTIDAPLYMFGGNNACTLMGEYYNNSYEGSRVIISGEGEISNKAGSTSTSSYPLVLKNLNIDIYKSGTFLESSDIYIDNCSVTTSISSGDIGGYAIVSEGTLKMKDSSYELLVQEATYICYSGIKCKNIEVDSCEIILNNSNPEGEGADLNFIYESTAEGFVRNSVLKGSGTGRTNFFDGQISIDVCNITLSRNSSLCHYNSSTERRKSSLRDSTINYVASTYLTFGKIIGCTFNNSVTTSSSLNSNKLQILCPSQIVANTFIGRSEMNFNSNKVVFTSNVMEYEQLYTDFPPGSEHANNLVSA